MSSPVEQAAVTIGRALVDLGMTTLYGVLGEGNIRVIGPLVGSSATRYVKAVREDGAVMMACGEASVTGDLAFASVTHGPGLTNSATPLVHAGRARLPVLLLAGGTDPNVAHGRQSMDQKSFVESTGAGYVRVASAASAVGDLRMAAAIARGERRPVVVDVGVDVQAGPAPAYCSPGRSTSLEAIAPKRDDLDRALGIIASARRPVVLAGRGAIATSARDAIVALADRLGAPLATTLQAKDLFRGHSFDLGICGTLSGATAIDTILASDCIVSFGASLNRDTGAEGSLFASKAVVQVDNDAAALGARRPVSATVLADAELAAIEMHRWIDELGVEYDGSLRTDALRERLAHSDPRREMVPFPTDAIDARLLSLALDAAFPAHRSLVSDSGRFMLSGWSWIRVPEPRAFVQTTNFGSIGLGLGAAIGAAFARPDRPVLATLGDGGAAMAFTELLTAVQYGLDIVVVVYNDAAYGNEIAVAEKMGLDPTLAELHPTDFAEMARGMGAGGVRIEAPADLDDLERIIAGRVGPLVIDVVTDPRTPIP